MVSGKHGIAGARDLRGGPRLGRVSDYQITYWRELPSLVTARDGDELAKAMLPPRFQEAIDEAAGHDRCRRLPRRLDSWRMVSLRGGSSNHVRPAGGGTGGDVAAGRGRGIPR